MPPGRLEREASRGRHPGLLTSPSWVVESLLALSLMVVSVVGVTDGLRPLSSAGTSVGRGDDAARRPSDDDSPSN
jgi:hypothetical protein